jgi:hypothetical protein
MQISSIFSFLVRPSKNEKNQPDIGGTKIPLDGNLYYMLLTVFERAAEDCNIEIAFTPSVDGTQFNQRRSDIIDLIKNRDIDHARTLAKRLQSVTTKRSGLGLFFVVLGNENSTDRIYISRFPADFGIIAEEKNDALYVELLERVFMKNAASYKSVVFDGSNCDSDFWVGKAIDKQIGNKSVAISSYWIHDFLLADFRTTSAQGTRRLAIAIKQTIDQTGDLEIKGELSAAARLAKSLNGQVINMENFADRFELSKKTKNALIATLKHPNLRFDQFQFSINEFSKFVRFRSLQISNGAVLTAPIGKFNECFTKSCIAEDSNKYIFSTQGTIVNERLRTSQS